MSDQKDKDASQESITAAQPPEPLGYYSPQPKRRHTTSPVPAAELVLSNPIRSRNIGCGSFIVSAREPIVAEFKFISSDDAYDQSLKFSGNLDLDRINVIIIGIAASGGCYYSIKNKYLTREMIDKLRSGDYHFHINERQSCPHCELPINVDGYICWNKGVIHDTPGIVIKNMCSCISH